jgi:phosphosulfolactate synthase
MKNTLTVGLMPVHNIPTLLQIPINEGLLGQRSWRFECAVTNQSGNHSVTKHPFSMVDLPAERSTTKPRSKGLTMMVDFGIPMGSLEDRLKLIGPYVDLGKIAVGTSRLYQEDYLRSKLALYKEFGIRPFLGGQFQEYVFATQGEKAIPAFLAEAKRVGFDVVEISDNCVPLNPDERKAQIRMALDHGLAVIGEVGSKTDITVAADLVDQARDCFEAGAELAIVEGAELVENGVPKTDLINELRAGLDMSKVLLELTGTWIKGITLSDVNELLKFFVTEFGPDVNVANVLPDEILETEALRVGLGVVGPDARTA